MLSLVPLGAFAASCRTGQRQEAQRGGGGFGRGGNERGTHEGIRNLHVRGTEYGALQHDVVRPVGVGVVASFTSRKESMPSEATVTVIVLRLRGSELVASPFWNQIVGIVS